MTHESPERRAEVIAAIYALGDFLKAHPELPAPHSVHAQFSIQGDLSNADAAEVRALAEGLGTPLLVDKAHRVDLWHTVASGHTKADGSFRVRYVIHGSRKQADTDGGAA